MEGQRLILNDGTVLENARAGLSSGFLWLRIPGKTFWEVADIVRDAEKMQHLIFQYGEMEDVYEGYTVCTMIMVDDDKISVSMVKG